MGVLFSSRAVAVIVIGSPTEYGPDLSGVNVSVGGSWFVVTATTAASETPSLSVTVTVALKSPWNEYLCVTTAPDLVLPSPKSHWNDNVSPGSGSDDVLASNVNVVFRLVLANGVTKAEAVGGQLPPPHPNRSSRRRLPPSMSEM